MLCGVGRYSEADHNAANGHTIAKLIAQRHRVLNVDLVPLDHPRVDNRIADLTDAEQVFDVMANYTGFDELDPGTGVPRFEAEHRPIYPVEPLR